MSGMMRAHTRTHARAHAILRAFTQRLTHDLTPARPHRADFPCPCGPCTPCQQQPHHTRTRERSHSLARYSWRVCKSEGGAVRGIAHAHCTQTGEHKHMHTHLLPVFPTEVNGRVGRRCSPSFRGRFLIRCRSPREYLHVFASLASHGVWYVVA